MKNIAMLFALIILAGVALPGTAFAHGITNIVSTPSSPASLGLNEQIDWTFDYVTDEPTGVRIFVRVMEWDGGFPTFNSHGSITYPTGSGSGTGYFYMTSSATTVTKVRLQMLDAAMENILLEVFVNVSFQIGTVANQASSFGSVKALFR